MRLYLQLTNVTNHERYMLLTQPTFDLKVVIHCRTFEQNIEDYPITIYLGVGWLKQCIAKIDKNVDRAIDESNTFYIFTFHDIKPAKYLSVFNNYNVYYTYGNHQTQVFTLCKDKVQKPCCLPDMLQYALIHLIQGNTSPYLFRLMWCYMLDVRIGNITYDIPEYMQALKDANLDLCTDGLAKTDMCMLDSSGIFHFVVKYSNQHELCVKLMKIACGINPNAQHELDELITPEIIHKMTTPVRDEEYQLTNRTYTSISHLMLWEVLPSISHASLKLEDVASCIQEAHDIMRNTNKTTKQ